MSETDLQWCKFMPSHPPPTRCQKCLEAMDEECNRERQAVIASTISASSIHAMRPSQPAAAPEKLAPAATIPA